MLSSFRRLSKSKVGTAILVVFLLAIVASFAMADINGMSGSLGGGSGSLAELTLPISGTATAQQTPPVKLPFTGSAVIQISLQYLPQPGASIRATANASGGTTNALKPNLTTTDPVSQPIVSAVFIAEFQLMLAMNIMSVSMR